MNGRGSGCVNWLGAALVLAVCAFLWASWADLQWLGGETARALAWFWEWLLWLVLCALGLFAVTIAGLVTLRRLGDHADRRAERLRQRDGSFALVTRRVRLADGTTALAVLDPNRLMGPGGLITDAGEVVDVVHPGLLGEYARVNEQRASVARVQAMAPGDRAVEQMRGQYRLPGSAWRVTNPPRPAGRFEDDAPDLPLLPAPPVAQMAPVDFLRASTATAWALGQEFEWLDEGRTQTRLTEGVFKLDWLAYSQLLVLGTTGSGKSAGPLTEFAMLGARHGEVAFFDPKGAGEYDELARWMSYYLAEPGTILHHLRGLEEIGEERRRVLRAAGVDDWRKLAPARPRLWIVFDEFFNLRMRLNGKAQAEFDRTVLRSITTCRVTGMHWVVAEQRPSLMPASYRGAFPMTIMFRLLAGQGGTFNESWAHKLRPGQFIAEGRTFQAPLMAPVAAELMRSGQVAPVAQKLLPDLSAEPEEGEYRVLDESFSENSENGANGWRERERTGERTGVTRGTEPIEPTEPTELGELRGARPPLPEPTEQVRLSPVADRIEWVIRAWEETYNERPRQVDVLRTMERHGWGTVKSYVKLIHDRWYGAEA